MSNRLASFVACAALAAGYASCFAASNTITFNEAPLGTPANGLTIDIVHFGFSEGKGPSGDCTVAGGPGVTPYVQDPSLEGTTAGELHLGFKTAVSKFSYGFALNTTGAFEGATVAALFAPNGDFLGVISADGDSTPPRGGGGGFTTGFLEADGFGLIGSALISFPAERPPESRGFGGSTAFSEGRGSAASRFAFDNLSYTFNSIPLPSALGMGLAGVGALAGLRRRRSV